MSKPFSETRRQVFLHQAYFSNQVLRREKMREAIAVELIDSGTSTHDASLLRATAAEQCYERLALLYTAGGHIEPLRSELTHVIEAYEQYQQALGTYEGVPTMSPLGLDQLGDYERCLQLIGLCYLLHRRDLLSRLAALIDPGYRGEDTLYEDLMSYVDAGRVDLDEWYHGEPYTALVNAMYAQDKTEASDFLKQYVENWYPHFKYVPWHDGHKRIDGTDGDYFGYWSFEAGAVALLCDIDDSAIMHMVYPKDLVAWAREHKALSEGNEPAALTRLRCEAGQPCPREGWWSTPAKPDSRRMFRAGEMMPAFTSDYGTTIWQRDESQP